MTPLCRNLMVFLLAVVPAAGETRVRIAGLKRKSESQVLDLLGARLENVRKGEASPSRADDAAFLLRQILRKDGFADVQVDWKVTGREEILLTVREGTRLALGQVTVTGVPPDEAGKLAKLFARPAEKERPLTAGDPPFRENDVATGLGYLQQDLNAQSYWGAVATVTSRTTDPATGDVALVIHVHPGPAHTIGQATIVSPDGRGVDSTRETVRPYIGKSATTGNLNAMRLAVEENFISQGYPDAKITMGRILAESKFSPQFYINIGKRVRLNRIRVAGLRKTNPDRILVRMEDLEGDWYDEAAMNKRLRGFLATGAFSSASVEKTPVSENSIDATLHLEEAKAREVSLAAGVDTYQGFIFRTTYTDRNLGGQVRGFSSGFEFSARGILGETKLTDPWLFGSDIAGTARAYALIYGREGYSSLETGIEGSTKWKIGDHYTLDVLAGYSVVNLTSEGLPDSEIGETVYTHPRFRVTHSFDFRDSPILPKNGWHLELPFEMGAALGDVSTAYVQTGINGGWYHKINANYEIGLGAEWEVLVPSGGGDNLPIDLRLFNGGARSVRSFQERELGPSANGYPTGGEAKWTTNAELVRTLTGTVKAVAFFDAGTLARNHEEIGTSEIELAIGLGLRLDLPIGPARLEYGYNLTQDPGEPVGTIQFAIGVAF